MKSMQTLVRVMIMYSDIAVHNTKCPTVEGFQLTEISLPLIIKNLYSKKDLFYSVKTRSYLTYLPNPRIQKKCQMTPQKILGNEPEIID